MNWQDSYESLWAMRHQLIKDLMGSGETHPARLHYLLQWFHRFYDPSGPIDHANNRDGFPLLPTGVPAFRTMVVEDQVVVVPFYDNPNDFLVDLLIKDKPEAVVELGSGYGRNLIELFYRGGPSGIPYYAGEFTESGTAFADTLGSLSADLPIVPFRFDHNDPDLSIVNESSFVVFFTCHSIEQVTKLRPDYFKILADQATRVMGIHFEPFGFQIPGSNTELDNVQKRYFENNNWNMNLYDVLQASAESGEINLKHVSKNSVSSTDRGNPTSLIVWESNS